MEILQKDYRELQLILTDDRLEGINEITPFVSSLAKIRKEVYKPGFLSMFNKAEKEVWISIIEKFYPDEAPKDKVSKETDSK